MSVPRLDVDEAAVQNKKAEKAIWPWHRLLPAEQTWRRKRRRRRRESERLARAHFCAMKEHLLAFFFFSRGETMRGGAGHGGVAGVRYSSPQFAKTHFQLSNN